MHMQNYSAGDWRPVDQPVIQRYGQLHQQKCKVQNHGQVSSHIAVYIVCEPLWSVIPA